jgi:hypothetical protein
MVDPSLRGTMGALGALGGGVTGVTGRDVPFFALIPRLEGHLRSAEAECETLRLERDDMRAALAASREETAAAERAHRDAEALATERLVTLRQTEAELEQTVDRLRNSQEALALVDEQVETMEERLADSQALPRQLKNLQLRFEGTEAKNVALEAELLKTLEELRAAQEVMKTMLPESRYGQLLRDVEHLRKQNNRLNGSYAVLLGKFEAAERDMERSREVQRAMTPRPDWARADALLGHAADIDFASPTTSSRAKVAAAVREIQSGVTVSRTLRDEMALLRSEIAEERDAEGHAIDRSVPASGEDYFVGLGTGPDVPKYLRYTGRIQNRRLAKGEVEGLVREIWKAKEAEDRVSRKPSTLPGFVHKFFTKRFGRQAMVASWGYNLVEALRRFHYDKDIELFSSILEGTLPEEVYHDQNAMLDKVIARLRSVDAQIHDGAETGLLPRIVVANTLRKIFPGKSAEDQLQLRRALHRDAPGKDIDYTSLFEDDEDFNQGDFAETLCLQHMNEIKAYRADVDAALQALEQTMPVIRASDIRAAIFSVDPHKSGSKVEEYLFRGLAKDPKNFDIVKKDPVVRDISLFLARLHTGLVKRSNRGAAEMAKAKAAAQAVTDDANVVASGDIDIDNDDDDDDDCGGDVGSNDNDGGNDDAPDRISNSNEGSTFEDV